MIDVAKVTCSRWGSPIDAIASSVRIGVDRFFGAVRNSG
jgi:hypothetical protein